MVRLNFAPNWHPRTYFYDNTAHIVTDCFRRPGSRFIEYAKITVKKSSFVDVSYYNLYKVQDVVTDKEN